MDLRHLQKDNKELKDSLQDFQKELIDSKTKFQSVEISMMASILEYLIH